jgi:putative protease
MLFATECPEVLAPAGDADSMRAAVLAGADAVYFGLHGTSARARATNFETSELASTVRFLHAHGVRGYVALNTLVFDAELARVESQVRACAEAAVDAVIVQDLGVARLVRAIAPDLAVHASTQMTCTDAASVELARAAGARRVILARELSLDDIAAIRRETDMELEVFVHGALCIAYSGQCLTSEAIGGRSANRGACAQACRLPYELVVDGVLQELGDRAHLLSPEDLEASAVVPDLVKLGVRSLKIEGRLKGPEYVAATTRLYRRAVDAAYGLGPAPSEELLATALQMYSRGSGPGFFRGVDHQRLVEGRTCDHRGLLAGEARGVRVIRGKRCVALSTAAPIARGDGIVVEGKNEVGGRVWAVFDAGREVENAPAGHEVALWLGPDRSVADASVPAGARVWKTSDPVREKEALAATSREPHRVRIDVRVRGRFGEKPVFEATTARGREARVVGDAPIERAHTNATSHEAVREKLARLGETAFVLGALDLDLPEGAMLPLSMLNRARRALTDALAEGPPPHAVTSVTHEEILAAARPPERAPPPAGLFVLCRSLEQAEAAVVAGADGVYLDFLELVGTGAAIRALRARPERVHVTLAPPRIRKPGEEKIDRYLAQLAPDALLVRSLGSLHDQASAAGIPKVGDFSLNVANKIAAASILERGVIAFTPSFDLDAQQLTALLDAAFAPYAEVVVHHPMPLFHMEHCVIAALLSSGKDHKTCGRPCEQKKVSLRDRSGIDHPVEADVGCRNTVFHAAAQSAASVIPALQRSGVRRFRIELVRERAEDVARIVHAYRALLSGRSSPDEVWRGLNSERGRTEKGYGVVRGSLRVIA